MKKIDIDQISELPGRQIKAGESFRFRCHPGVSCFNRCCRNLNLFLYPYDVARLRKCLQISSDVFLEKYTDVVLRPGTHFPEVLLRMADNAEKTCPFLTADGCSVYPDRPDTCRTFPVEHGLLYNNAGKAEMVHFFRPPDFCMGQHEDQELTLENWAADQEAVTHNRMTAEWAEVRALFQKSPWGLEDPSGPKAKMTFMAAYNIDAFRSFVFQSSFLKRYKIKKDLQIRLRRNDVDMLRLGFEWIRFYLWGITPEMFRIK